jgi:predicted DNA-binding protein (UPF0251 family)
LHRPQRQACRLRVLALAGERHRKGLAHPVVEPALHVVGNARGRGHALAVDDLHLGARRERAVALHRDEAQRLLLGRLVAAEGLQQARALLALEQLDRNALAHAVGRAPDVLAHALQRGRAVELEHEHLLLVDAGVGARHEVAHERAAAIELVAFRAGELAARAGLEGGNAGDGAAHAGRQVVLEVVDPGLGVGPAAGALAGLRIGAAHRERGGRLGVAEIDGRLVELGDDLAHARHFALGREAGDLECKARYGQQRARGQEQ